jgi:hypothetical protein
MMRQVKIIAAAVAIFLAGITTGVSLSRGFRPAPAVTASSPDEMPRIWQRLEVVRRALRGIDIPEEQRTRIESHLKAGQRHLRRIWEPVAPAANAEIAEVRRRVLSELDPVGRARLEAELIELGKRRTNGFRGRSEGTAATNALSSVPPPSNTP